MVKSYQGFRGFLALGVFAVHLSILRQTALANVYDNWLIGCGGFCVLFFFLLSGFGIGSSFAHKGNSAYTYQGLKNYYWRRIKAIYPASIIIMLAWIFWDRATIFSDFSQGLKQAIGNLLLIEDLIHVPRINPVSWYLSFLLLYYAVAPLIAFLLSKIKWRPAFHLMIAAIFIGQIIMVTRNLDNPAHQQLFYTNWKFRFFDFLMGLILGFALQKPVIRKNSHRYLFFSCLEIGSLILCAFFFYLRIYVPVPYLHGTYYAPFIFLILIVFHEDGGILSKFLSRPSVQLFGGLSLYFYLIHFKVLLHVSTSGIPRISYIILTALGVSLIFSLLLYILLHFNKTIRQLKALSLQPIIEKLALLLSVIIEAGCVITCYQKICAGQAASAAALFVVVTLTVVLLLFLVFYLLKFHCASQKESDRP